MTTVDEEIAILRQEWEDAESDVLGDNPDAEPGWENDVIRSIVRMSEVSEEAKSEFLRMQGVASQDDLLWTESW